MKTFIVTAVLLSTSAFAACPSLAGTYKVCTSSNGSTASNAVVTQTLKNGVTTYTIASTDDSTNERTSETYIADGKLRTTSEKDPESGMEFTTKTQASCEGENLKIAIKVSTDGELFADLSLVSKRVSQRLINETKGIVFGETISETQTCE